MTQETATIDGMARESIDFLAESVLWSDREQEGGYPGLRDEELRAELASYRQHVLATPIADAQGLSVALSARERLPTPEGTVKRSALYFDEVLLPDPVFALTEWTRERTFQPVPEEAPRADLIEAVRYVRSLVPLVRIGRVRFVPSTRDLEGPEKSLLLYSEDNFAGRVPAHLRDWFRARAEVRKVVTDKDGRRLVLLAEPDLKTSTIQISFGQVGQVHGYDHMRIVELKGDDGSFTAAQMPPGSVEALHAWVEQSINRSAGDLFRDVLADVSFAWRHRCSFVTGCSTTAELLDRATHSAIAPQFPMALTLDLPMVDTASVEQLADLIDRETSAFEALRYEIHEAAEALRSIHDTSERMLEMQKINARLAREQVQAVERKIREARRSLKWDIPLTIAQLTAGFLGLVSDDPSFANLTAGLVTGGATAASAIRNHFEHRELPGYFLWRLGKENAASR